MTCLYNLDHLTHKCMMWDEDEADHINSPEGTDEDGYCCADEDPDPTWCQSYEPADREWD
jgi:hypothetical protein